MFRTPPAVPAAVNDPATEWLQHSIEDYSGGLNTADPASSLGKGQFTALSNFYILPNRKLKVRGPFRPWLVASEDTVMPDSAPPLTFAIVELRGNDYRVASWDNGANYEVSVYDETNNRWAGEGAGTSIKANLTDGYKVRFVKYSVNEAEDLLFCNGYDVPQRWVGTVDTASTDLGLTAPTVSGISIAEDNSLGANDRGMTDTGTYYYKFTNFYDDSGSSTKYGESGPSTAVSGTISNATQTNPIAIDITGMTLASGVSKLFIYRAPPDQSNGPYEYVGFADSSTYKDNMPNDEEGVEIPVDAGTPPRLKNPLVLKGRLWGIGVNSAGALTNKGVWSRNGNPDYFDATAFTYFPDPLIGPKAFRKNVFWFTEKQIWVTNVPEKDADAIPQPLHICDIGCDSFDSIVDVGTGLVWQFEGNIYWANFNDFNPMTGDLPWPIGDPIRDKIANIPTAQVANSAGEFHKDRYYLSITGPNQTVNTSTLVWDVESGTRLLRAGAAGGWVSLNWKANDLQSFDETLYTLDNTNKYIMEHDFAGADDYLNKSDYDGATVQNIATQIATGDIFFGHEWSEKIINSLSVMVETSGVTYEATLAFNGNEFERTKQFVLGSDSLAVDSTWLIWDEGTWGDFNWADSTYAFQSDHKATGKGGKGRYVRLTLESTDSQDTTLILIKIYHKILPSPA
jgi:hypothetical protein